MFDVPNPTRADFWSPIIHILSLGQRTASSQLFKDKSRAYFSQNPPRALWIWPISHARLTVANTLIFCACYWLHLPVRKLNSEVELPINQSDFIAWRNVQCVSVSLDKIISTQFDVQKTFTFLLTFIEKFCRAIVTWIQNIIPCIFSGRKSHKRLETFGFSLWISLFLLLLFLY